MESGNIDDDVENADGKNIDANTPLVNMPKVKTSTGNLRRCVNTIGISTWNRLKCLNS